VPELDSLPNVKTPIRTRVTPLMLQTQKQLELKQAMLGDPLMPLSEAAPMLGNPSYSTLRKWIRNGSLHVWRAGRGHYKVKLSEVRRFVGAGEKK
jgi:excisionase family DNA binding protein